MKTRYIKHDYNAFAKKIMWKVILFPDAAGFVSKRIAIII